MKKIIFIIAFLNIDFAIGRTNEIDEYHNKLQVVCTPSKGGPKTGKVEISCTTGANRFSPNKGFLVQGGDTKIIQEIVVGQPSTIIKGPFSPREVYFFEGKFKKIMEQNRYDRHTSIEQIILSADTHIDTSNKPFSDDNDTKPAGGSSSWCKPTNLQLKKDRKNFEEELRKDGWTLEYSSEDCNFQIYSRSSVCYSSSAHCYIGFDSESSNTTGMIDKGQIICPAYPNNQCPTAHNINNCVQSKCISLSRQSPTDEELGDDLRDIVSPQNNRNKDGKGLQ